MAVPGVLLVLGTPLSSSVLDEVHIIVGTADCVLDMIQRQEGDDCLASIRQVVIDEADETFCRGLKDDVINVIQLLPSTTQIILLASTIPIEVGEFTKQFMHDPIQINHVIPQLTPNIACVKQFYINVEREEWKLDTLCDLYETLASTKTVVFCSTDRNVDFRKVDKIAAKMRSHDMEVVAMPAGTSRAECRDIMREFQNGTAPVLITTDRCARGIDLQWLRLVINYDLPTRRETYQYRFGQ